MTTLAYTLSDSRVMLRRNLKHQLRYPSMTVMLIGIPIVLLLLFVYVFGGQLGAGLGAHEGRSAYLNYVVPGLLLLTVASAIQGTSIMVAMDMTGGIIDRFRTMAIARASVLTGHVLGSLIQTLVAIAVLIAVAFGLGFRSAAGPLHWLAAIGILALFAFALIWLAVALGLAAKSVETASNTPMILFLLLFLSSGFVATATMPTGLRQFAEYQPFTPVADTVRGLLSGAAIGDHAIAAIAWSIGIAVVAYLWAIRLYNRRRAAEPAGFKDASHVSGHARRALLRSQDRWPPHLTRRGTAGSHHLRPLRSRRPASRHHQPAFPSIRSLIRSACPVCPAYSPIMWMRAQRSDISPQRGFTKISSSGMPATACRAASCSATRRCRSRSAVAGLASSKSASGRSSLA